MMGLYRQQLFTQELLTLCPMMPVADPLLLTDYPLILYPAFVANKKYSCVINDLFLAK